jgi:hypothetical protein
MTDEEFVAHLQQIEDAARNLEALLADAAAHALREGDRATAGEALERAQRVATAAGWAWSRRSLYAAAEAEQ